MEEIASYNRRLFVYTQESFYRKIAIMKKIKYRHYEFLFNIIEDPVTRIAIEVGADKMDNFIFCHSYYNGERQIQELYLLSLDEFYETTQIALKKGKISQASIDAIMESYGGKYLKH